MTFKLQKKPIAILLLVIVSTTGCVSQIVKSTTIPPVKTENIALPEDELLDVGISIFAPGLDKEEENIFPAIRQAEALYIPYTMMETIQSSGAWGAVRVVPDSQQVVDLMVSGTIISSDGEMLEVKIIARDSTGRIWINKPYKAATSKYSYEANRSHRHKLDPFQAIYNSVANDLLARQQQFTRQQALEVRLVSELKFAQSFSKDAFGAYLNEGKNKLTKIARLPAANDPMLERVRKIRERDHLFIDTMQEHYASFNNQMSRPYQEWRKQSYGEVIALRELKSESTKRMIAGVAAIVGGIAAAGSDNRSARTAGNVAIAGGGYMVKSGLDKRAESEIHVEALGELGASLEAEVTPQVIKLEDRSITLSGSVEDQYRQWRSILKKIYETEFSEQSASNSVTTNVANVKKIRSPVN
jgi:hypothetical protein